MSKSKPPKLSSNPAAAALGSLGGAARAAKMTKAERIASARKAAAARWKDHERKGKPKKQRKSGRKTAAEKK